MIICEGMDNVPDHFQIGEDVNSVTIPATVTRIGRFALRRSSGLREIIFEGESLTWIGCCAFSACPGLVSVEFPGSLVTIDPGAFRDCTSLEMVSFRTGTGRINELGRWAFANTRIVSCEVQELIDEENLRRHPNDVAVLSQDLSWSTQQPCQMLTREGYNGIVLRVEERSSVPRIRDVAELFGFDYQQVVRGFTATGGISHPTIPHTGIWWPRISSRPNQAGWLNVVSYDEDGDIVRIVERNVVNNVVNQNLMAYHQNEIQRQVVVANIEGQRCDTGYCYRFIGVFELNVQETQQERACVWCRVATEWPL